MAYYIFISLTMYAGITHFPLTWHNNGNSKYSKRMLFEIIYFQRTPLSADCLLLFNHQCRSRKRENIHCFNYHCQISRSIWPTYFWRNIQLITVHTKRILTKFSSFYLFSQNHSHSNTARWINWAVYLWMADHYPTKHGCESLNWRA